MAAKTTAKKPKTPQKPTREAIVSSALSLAAKMDWALITMSDIAEEAGTNLAVLSEMFDDKTDILVAYGRALDKKVLEACGEGDPGASPRDRLFDILMERFDILSVDREAILSILKSFAPDPKQAVISLPHLGRSMAWMLEAAGVDTGGMRGAVRVAGLTVVYLNVVRHWMKDESEDLSRTMASLDKNLSRAEQAASTLML